MTDTCINMLSNHDISNNNKLITMIVCDLSGCNKKLKLVDTYRPCKCKKCFCDQHRCFDSHKCDFIYQRTFNDTSKMIEQMKCVKSKIEIL